MNNEFPEEYIPTVFENYDTNVKYKGNNITLSVWDTVCFITFHNIIDYNNNIKKNNFGIPFENFRLVKRIMMN